MTDKVALNPIENENVTRKLDKWDELDSWEAITTKLKCLLIAVMK